MHPSKCKLLNYKTYCKVTSIFHLLTLYIYTYILAKICILQAQIFECNKIKCNKTLYKILISLFFRVNVKRINNILRD